MLIIQSLAESGSQLDNLSDSDDTKLMQQALLDTAPVKDVGHAGTAMRFLTAYYAICNGEVILTGSDRMRQRPIGPLVDALRNLGAEIDFMEKEGCPPLRILGGMKTGGSISVDGGISSQFISALMMIGPVLEGGLHITLTGDVVSPTYIEMTLSLMKTCGIGASFDGREVRIPQGNYSMDRFMVESDWSGASYWYQVAALLPGSVITLPHLMEHSLQVCLK